MEIGNEDWFDNSGSYDGRFTQMAKAIREKYPNLKIIATAPVKSFKPDLYDDHFYRNPQTLMNQASQYDKSRRGCATEVQWRRLQRPPAGRDLDVCRRMGGTGGPSHDESPIRFGRRRIRHGPGEERRRRGHGMLCAAVGQRESRRVAVALEPHRL